MLRDLLLHQYLRIFSFVTFHHGDIDANAFDVLVTPRAKAFVARTHQNHHAIVLCSRG